MEQSGGGRKRRIARIALGGAGLYAAMAYASAVLGPPSHLDAQPAVPASQVAAATAPPSSMPPVPFTGSADRDSTPPAGGGDGSLLP